MNIYKEYSKKFLNLLSEYVPAIEQYSIDEVFCDMTGTEKLYGSPIETAYFLKNKVRDTLGFTVNVGISTNKLLAKMAGDFEKPDKVHTLFPNEIKDKMWPLPVSDLFSVGKATSSRLDKLGIYTIGHLASADISMLISQFGASQGELLHNYALGIASDEICTKEREYKGYGNSVTLPKDVTTYDDARTILLSLCESVATRLRKDKKKASKITVFYTTNNFVKKSHQQRINSSTDVTLEIFQMACDLFKEFWNEETPLRLIGVQASQVSEEIGYQYHLFENSPENRLAPDRHEKLVKLDQAIDTIRNRFGSDSITRTSLFKK
jgi:DNA polymerase-4